MAEGASATGAAATGAAAGAATGGGVVAATGMAPVTRDRRIDTASVSYSISASPDASRMSANSLTSLVSDLDDDDFGEDGILALRKRISDKINGHVIGLCAEPGNNTFCNGGNKRHMPERFTGMDV